MADNGCWYQDILGSSGLILIFKKTESEKKSIAMGEGSKSMWEKRMSLGLVSMPYLGCWKEPVDWGIVCGFGGDRKLLKLKISAFAFPVLQKWVRYMWVIFVFHFSNAHLWFVFT